MNAPEKQKHFSLITNDLRRMVMSIDKDPLPLSAIFIPEEEFEIVVEGLKRSGQLEFKERFSMIKFMGVQLGPTVEIGGQRGRTPQSENPFWNSTHNDRPIFDHSQDRFESYIRELIVRINRRARQKPKGK